MAEKKIVQDIIASNKRTIRDVPVHRLEINRKSPKIERIEDRDVEIDREYDRETKETIIETKKERIRVMPSSHDVPRTANSTPKSRKGKFSGMLVTFIIVFLGIAVIAVALSLLYSKASVTITPKVANFNIKGTFTAKKAPVESTSLPYEVITKEDGGTQTIAAADGPLVQTKSKGIATLFNEQNTPQKIVAGTRLANADGLVYRTAETVTIPSMSKNPGTVTVEIVADQAGIEYNMSADGSTNLKIVAYKGTPKYTTVYWKSKTAIAGGFSGNKKIISPEAQKAAVLALETSLKTQLIDKVKNNVPNGYIFFDNNYSIDYEVSEPVSKDPETAIISIKASLYGVIFNKKTLLKSIANKELDKFPSPTYDIKGLEDLSFSIVNAKDFSAKKGSSLIFSLNGQVQIIGTFPENELKNELKGTYLKQSNLIFAHYPAIASAYALITPFWMRSFPNSPENIHIEVKH